MKELISHIQNEIWAVVPSRLAEVMAVIKEESWFGIDSPRAAPHMAYRVEVTPEGLAVLPVGRPLKGAVAVIPVRGFIQQKANLFLMLFGGTSTELVAQQLRQAVGDDGVKAILLDVDSPGGTISGVEELASEIYALRGKKPIIASIGPLGASAAYWIASQADDIAVQPSGLVGNIGIFAVHQDWSKFYEEFGVDTTLIAAGKYKTEGNPFEALSAEGREAWQQRVNDSYTMFVNAVARGRKVSASDVRNGYGEGRLVTARDALRLGMVDRVATFENVLARLGGSGGALASAMAEDTPPSDPPPQGEREGFGMEARERRLRLASRGS